MTLKNINSLMVSLSKYMRLPCGLKHKCLINTHVLSSIARVLTLIIFEATLITTVMSSVWAAKPSKQQQADSLEKQQNVNLVISKHSIAVQQVEVQADNYLRKGNEFLFKADYKKAIDSYIHAVEILRNVNGGKAPEVQQKIIAAKRQIFNAYGYWAKQLAKQAEEKATVADFDKAIELIKKAMAMYPAGKKQLEKKLLDYQRSKKKLERKVEVDINNLDPNHKEQLYDVEVLMRQAQALMAKERWERAKRKYEEVLLINPYNSKATQGLRAAVMRMNDIALKRSYNVNKERMAELEWNATTPISLQTDSNEKELLQQAVTKRVRDNELQQKLRALIIPKINFEDLPLPLAINHLREQSKKLDPEGKGVNIFLRVTVAKPKVDEKKVQAGTEVSEAEEEELLEEEDDYAGYPTVNLLLNDKSLYEIITLLCENTQLKFRVEEYAVVIASGDVPLDDLETKIFPINQGSLAMIGGGEDKASLVNHFKSRGITFPEGAEMVYDAAISRLIATNTLDNLSKIEDIIQNELSAQDPMVQIQAKFVEIEQNDLKELGFDWLISSNGAFPGTTQSSQNTNGRLAMNASDSLVRSLDPGNDSIFVFGRDNLWGDVGINFKLQALNQADSKNVLSSPKVTTLNGQEASIRMIHERYFPDDYSEAKLTTTTGGADSTGGGAQTYTYVSAVPEFSDPTELGIILRITPKVDLERRLIAMRVNPTVQTFVKYLEYTYELTTSGGATGGGALTREEKILKPIIAARTIDTQVSVYDGETIVVGGIVQDDNTIIDDKVPILGDIPLIGRLFQSRGNQSKKRNLLIFITCKLVKPDGTPFFPARRKKGLPRFDRLS